MHQPLPALVEKLNPFPLNLIQRLIFGFTLLAHWLGCVWYGVVESGETGLGVYLLPNSDSSETEGLGHYYRWVLSLYSAVCMMLGNYYAVSDEVREWWVHIAALIFGGFTYSGRSQA